MTNVEPKGAVHWIDHYVVGTNDLPGWSYWALHATGLPLRPFSGSLPLYEGKEQEDYLREFVESIKKEKNS